MQLALCLTSTLCYDNCFSGQAPRNPSCFAYILSVSYFGILDHSLCVEQWDSMNLEKYDEKKCVRWTDSVKSGLFLEIYSERLCNYYYNHRLILNISFCMKETHHL